MIRKQTNRKPAANRDAMDYEKINMQHCETYTTKTIKTNCPNLFGHYGESANIGSSIYMVINDALGYIIGGY